MRAGRNPPEGIRLNMQRLNIFNPFGAPVFYLPETDSTMEEARQIAESPELKEGSAVITAYQRSGRGRLRSRSWSSAPGKSILATLIFRRGETDRGGSSMEAGIDIEAVLPNLSIRIALAVCRFLEHRFSLFPEIKWPNDVLVGGKKISGILIEATASRVFVGTGINCLQGGFGSEWAARVTEEFAGAGAQSDSGRSVEAGSLEPTSIFLETGKELDPMEEFSYLLKEVQEILALKAAKSIAEAEKRLYRRGERVALLEGHPDRAEVIEGVLLGLDAGGALRLRTDDGDLRRISSGEFLLGPR